MKRTIPVSFPWIERQEVWTGMPIKVSVMRRLAQMQNYLWANLRNVWNNGGSEGGGQHEMANDLYPRLTELRGAPYELHTDGKEWLKAAQFYVPQNWCSGSRLRIRTTVLDITGGFLMAELRDLNGNPLGVRTIYVSGVVSLKVNVVDLFLDVPRDKGDCQCVLWLRNEFTDNTTQFHKRFYLFGYSARYVNGPGDVSFVPSAWTNKHNLTDVSRHLHMAASVFYDSILQNTLWHWSKRNPEIAHAWLGQHWNNTTTWTPVAEYWVNIPRACDVRYWITTQGMGVSGDWEIVFDGVTKATGTVDPFGGTATGVFTVDAGEDVNVKVNVKTASTTTTDFGSILCGIKLVEDSYTLGTGETVPADFTPLDEDEIRAEKLLYLENSLVSGTPAGFVTLQNNDRWLLVNRRRVLVSDWRNRILKAGGYSTGTSSPDERTDFTRHHLKDLGYDLSAEMQGNMGGWRNITAIGEGALDDHAPIAAFGSEGVTHDDLFWGGGGTGYSTTPFNWPSLYGLPGGGYTNLPSRMLLKSFVRNNVDMKGASKRRLFLRCRRLRPHDWNRDGYTSDGAPTWQEPAYKGKSFITVWFGGQDKAVYLPDPETEAKWVDAGTLNAEATDEELILLGRIPPLPNKPNSILTLAYQEGMLWSIELQSLCFIDEPLTQVELDNL